MKSIFTITISVLLLLNCIAQAEQSTGAPFVSFRVLGQPVSKNVSIKDPLNDTSWFIPAKKPLMHFSFARTQEEQTRRNSILRTADQEGGVNPPVFTVSQSLRLAETVTQSPSDVFQLLSQFTGLLNLNAVATKLSGDDEWKPTMAIQVVLVNFAVREKYDFELGPSYVLVNSNTHCLQLGVTIKFLDTPRLQEVIDSTPVLRLEPANLSRFYLYAGVGTIVDEWERWNVSFGVGVQMGK